MKIGFGYDVHRFSEHRELYLGGILIPESKGLVGHSDADCLVHAIVDALFGAACIGDIGTHFPPTDNKYKDIRSTVLLEEAVKILREMNLSIENIDSTIAAQEPKLSPYISEMRRTIAGVCGISENFVSVKATTTEKMGFEGRGEGISAYAVCLLSNK